MYYLQSRYYDAVVGRFVNADDCNIVISTFNSYNHSFIFCNNDAINNYDFYGFISIKAMAMVTCAIAGAVYAVSKASQLINKNYFKKNGLVVDGLTIYLAAFIAGGIAGLFAGSKITGYFNLIMGAIGAIISVIVYLKLHKKMLHSKIKSSDVLWVAIKGFYTASIGVSSKSSKKYVIQCVLKAVGLGALVGFCDLFLFF